MAERICEHVEIKGLFRRRPHACGDTAHFRVLKTSTPPWHTIPVCGKHVKGVCERRLPAASVQWTVKEPTVRESTEFFQAVFAGHAPPGSRAEYEVAKMEMRAELEEKLEYDRSDESSVLQAARQVVGDGTLFVVRMGGGFAIDFEPAYNNAPCVMLTADRVAFVGTK